MKYFCNPILVAILVFCFSSPVFSQNTTTKEIERLKKIAQEVTIIRDNWGIAHVYGKTDADAVFGLCAGPPVSIDDHQL